MSFQRSDNGCANYTVGDLYDLAIANASDLSTVPVIIAGPHGEIEYVAEFISAHGEYPERIQLVPKLEEIESLTY